ncbi:hypothetical protein [Paenibacillus faecalis]|uniref:hypothetical protein n=1 Tax=Paenibacillus faecalis TaxID=2079532 RepID=UPI000D0E3C28|nr:hypothetical protein [Paenibacillus faecalis]
MNRKLSSKQKEALKKAEHNGGRLIRGKGGLWTYEGAATSGETWYGLVTPEWYCTTNTIFALVRRGHMTLDDFDTCSLVKDEQGHKTGEQKGDQYIYNI